MSDRLQHRCHLDSLFLSNAPARTEIYTVSLHDALPISDQLADVWNDWRQRRSTLVTLRAQLRTAEAQEKERSEAVDRKSTRLNSSHVSISYAVFCLKKKKSKLHILSQEVLRLA